MVMGSGQVSGLPKLYATVSVVFDKSGTLEDSFEFSL